MALTNAEVDSAVPVAGEPSRTLTNSALKELIVDVAAAQTYADSKVEDNLTTSATVAPSKDAVITALLAKLDTSAISAFMQTVLDDANAPAARATLVAAASDNPVFTGTVTFDGSQIIAPVNMTSHVIQVDKGQNNEASALAANTTYTASATPADNTWFSIYAQADGTDRVITLPVAWTVYSMTQNAVVTAFTLRANKRMYVNFVHGTTNIYLMWNEPVQVIGQITFVFDGSGQVLSTGIKADVQVPYNAKLLSWTLTADQTGSLVVDLWKDTYANYPPVVGDTITASAKPTLTAASKNTNATLTGWTTTITAGDIIRPNIDSVATCTRATLTLVLEKT